MRITFVHLGKENLGIEYLSAVLKEAGHKTSLSFDIGLFGPTDNVFYIPFLERIFDCKRKVIAEIEKSNPDLVAFSVYTNTYPWACDIARIVKEKMGVRTVFGGIHATLVPEVLIENPYVDFVIEGEGEYALLELAESLSSGKSRYSIDNLWYKQDNKIIRNKIRPPVQNLDCLPLPDKELFEKGINYRDDYFTMTVRGCVYNCSYCCESYMNKIYKNFSRRRGVGSVMKELNIMKHRYQFRRIFFIDPVFFTNKTWLKELMKRYKKEIDVPFRCFGHTNHFDEEVGRLLKYGGCYAIEFGFQTINDSIKKKILNCATTSEQAKKTFDTCDKLKLRYDIDHMFELPQEKEEDHIQATRFYSRLKYLNRIKCHNLTYFPKLKIVEIARQNNLLTKNDIDDIKNGLIGNFLNIGSLKDKTVLRRNKNFKLLYKILPLLPFSFIRWILGRRLYRKFYLIPSFAVILLQLLIAIKNRDYRYFIYLKYYPIICIKRLISG